MESYINLLAFRKKNRLTQQQVADFIGTTKAFISQVETGVSKLPDKKLKTLYFSPWDSNDLIPHFTRLIKAWREYNKRNGRETVDLYPLEESDPFNLGSTTIYCLFYGNAGIDDEIANAIISVMPDISREWLLQGTGEMIATQITTGEVERIALLEERVRALEETVNRLKKVFK